MGGEFSITTTGDYWITADNQVQLSLAELRVLVDQVGAVHEEREEALQAGEVNPANAVACLRALAPQKPHPLHPLQSEAIEMLEANPQKLRAVAAQPQPNGLFQAGVALRTPSGIITALLVDIHADGLLILETMEALG
jgi:hypothetical protein